MKHKKGLSILVVCAVAMGTSMASATAPEQNETYQIVKGSVEESKGRFVFESNNIFNAFVADRDYSWEDKGIACGLKEGDVIGSYQGDGEADVSVSQAAGAEKENSAWEENGVLYSKKEGDVFGSYQGDQTSDGGIQPLANNEVWANHYGTRQTNSTHTQERVYASTQAYIKYTANNCVHNERIDSYSRAQYVLVWVRQDSGRQWNRNAGLSVAYTDWIDKSDAQQFQAKTFWGTED